MLDHHPKWKTSIPHQRKDCLSQVWSNVIALRSIDKAANFLSLKTGNHFRYLSIIEKGTCRVASYTDYYCKLGHHLSTGDQVKEFMQALDFIVDSV